MAIYKYVSAASGLRYLNSWRLRLSTVRTLNDPFELSPGVAPALEAEMLVRRAARKSKNDGKSEGIAEALRELRVMTTGGRATPSFADSMREVVEATGILCLTRTRRHLLMWSHYADCHRGMLLEFNEKHACFNRAPKSDDLHGRLLPVKYSDERPLLVNLTMDNFDEVLSTKALEWAYEQEVRMFWQLEGADSSGTLDERGREIHLIDVPASALRSITIGCAATNRKAVLAALKSTVEARHVEAFAAVVHETEFTLRYERLAP